MSVCTNCGAEDAGKFCPACGEQQPGHHDLTVGHFAHDVVHELVHLDSKLFKTLRELVVRPGLLTVEYFAGRKSRYIRPLRLFLTLFALQFIAFTFYKPAAIFSVASFQKFDNRGALTKMVEKRATKKQMTVEAYRERVDERWHKNLSLLQFMHIIGVALVLKLLHRRRFLVEHLVFSAHFLSFSYIMMLVLVWPIYAVAGFDPGPLQKVLSGITIAILLVYLYLAQRRFYDDGKGKTVMKTVLAWIGRYVIEVVILGGSLAVALLRT
jgi:hypothetical protein